MKLDKGNPELKTDQMFLQIQPALLRLCLSTMAESGTINRSKRGNYISAQYYGSF